MCQPKDDILEMAKLQVEYDTQDVMLQSRNPSGFPTGKSQQKDQESFS